MKQKIFKIHYLYILLLLAFVSIVISAYIAGAPTASTNAPGENTCYGSPLCHAGTPNTGPGFGEMTVMDGVPPGNLYIPGQTYEMMPYTIDSIGRPNSGFQAVALLSSGNGAGEVTLTMPMYTQFITSGGKEYVENTPTGAVEPTTDNMHDWMYDWEAPPPGSGTVTFYAAFVTGDGDSSASGDNIYTDTLVLYEDTTAGIGILDMYNTKGFAIKRVYPLPTDDFVNIDISMDKYSELHVSVVDIEGRIALHKTLMPINQPGNSFKLNLKGLNAGIYFVKVKQDDKPVLHSKIVKQ